MGVQAGLVSFDNGDRQGAVHWYRDCVATADSASEADRVMEHYTGYGFQTGAEILLNERTTAADNLEVLGGASLPF